MNIQTFAGIILTVTNFATVKV